MKRVFYKKIWVRFHGNLFRPYWSTREEKQNFDGKCLLAFKRLYKLVSFFEHVGLFSWFIIIIFSNTYMYIRYIISKGKFWLKNIRLYFKIYELQLSCKRLKIKHHYNVELEILYVDFSDYLQKQIKKKKKQFTIQISFI